MTFKTLVVLFGLLWVQQSLAHASPRIEVHERYSKVSHTKPQDEIIPTRAGPRSLSPARPIEPIRRFDLEGQRSERQEATVDYYDDADEQDELEVAPAQCPPGRSGLLPHPSDCAKFLNCHAGKTFIQDCAPGTLFNPKVLVCDWPKNVQCQSSSHQAKALKGFNGGSGVIDVRLSEQDDMEPQPTRVSPVYVAPTSRPSTTTTRVWTTSRPQGTGRVIGMRPPEGSDSRIVFPQNPGPVATPPPRRNIGWIPQASQQIPVTVLLPPKEPPPNRNPHQIPVAVIQTPVYAPPEVHTPVYVPSTTPATPARGIQPPAQRKTPFLAVHNYNRQYYGPKPTEPSVESTTPNMVQLSDALKMLLRPYMKGAETELEMPPDLPLTTETPKAVIPISNTSTVLSRVPYSPTPKPASTVLNRVPATSSTPRPDECEFRCQNQRCVKSTHVCNGRNDCGDRSDEASCEHVGYQVRLTNHRGRTNEGHIEVRAYGRWGAVCDDKFDMAAANVACRELGFSMGASEYRLNSYYSTTERDDDEGGTYIMDEVDCQGNETSLKDCNFSGWGVHDCGADEKVGVICKTSIMECPENYILCDVSQECIPVNFLCDNVYDCADQMDESPKYCNSSIEVRLADGKDPTEGRLEVRYRGIWGTVCDDEVGLNEAKAVCQQLGYFGDAEVVKGRFGPGKGPIWLDQWKCNGDERNIDECAHWQWGENNCAHTEDVGIKCYEGPKKGKGGRGNSFGSKTARKEEFEFIEKSSKSLKGIQCGKVLVAPPAKSDIREKVVQGTPAYRGQHPWQASIRAKKHGKSVHWCGAVLISPHHLLTAAHCLIGYPKGVYIVRVGDFRSDTVENTEVEVNVEHMYIHEDFRKGHHMNNDIAMVLLKSPIRFNTFVQPVCLPEKDTPYRPGQNCSISGWGAVSTGSSLTSHDLRAGSIPLQSDEVCRSKAVYGDAITEGMFCAGTLDRGAPDTADGDSGGPLVCEEEGSHVLFGITSWGQQSNKASKPGVYVRVAQYLDWLEQKLEHSKKTYGT